jgi:hypothetical protein
MSDGETYYNGTWQPKKLDVSRFFVEHDDPPATDDEIQLMADWVSDDNWQPLSHIFRGISAGDQHRVEILLAKRGHPRFKSETP